MEKHFFRSAAEIIDKRQTTVNGLCLRALRSDLASAELLVIDIAQWAHNHRKLRPYRKRRM